MGFIKKIVLLCLVLNVVISEKVSENTKNTNEPRVKRNNVHYSVTHNNAKGSFRLERRIATNPSAYQLPGRYSPFYTSPWVHQKRGRPHSIPAPPYAVQMEPLVQYSQRDPLYDTNKLIISTDTHNDLNKHDDLLTENNHLSENVYQHNFYAKNHAAPIYYQPEPEPIIEIIIKESNVTLPPVPVPTIPPKKKEPVQVFYVKYKKNPHGSGKDSVIYDPPIPALAPKINDEEHHHHEINKPQEYVTLPPPPSTTIRTIIRPDSETFIGTKGIHVTFGSEKKKHEKHDIEGHVESVPQPSVIFPRPDSPSPPKNFDHASSRQAYPPNFANPNFNGPPSQTRNFPSFNQPLKFSNNPPFRSQFNNFPSQPTNYRPNNPQQNRSFPNQFQQRPPSLTQSLPSPQQRQPFNSPPAFNFNHHTTTNGPFRHPPFPQPQRPEFPPITFTQKPPTHFPFPQPNQQFFNQAPIQQNDQRPGFQNNHQSQFNFQHNREPLPSITHSPLERLPSITNPPLQQQSFNQNNHNHPLPHPQQLQSFQQGPRNPQPSHQQFHNSNSQNIQQEQHGQPQILHHQLQQQNNFHHQQIQNNAHHLKPQQQIDHHQQIQNNAHHLKPQQQIDHHQQNIQQQKQSHFSSQVNQQNHHSLLHNQQRDIIPPGGELVKSVPKYEQHVSIPITTNQNTQQNSGQNNLPQPQQLIQGQTSFNQNPAISYNFNEGVHNVQQVHQSHHQIQTQTQNQFRPHQEESRPQQQTPLTSHDYQQYLQQQYNNIASQTTTPKASTQPTTSAHSNHQYFSQSANQQQVRHNTFLQDQKYQSQYTTTQKIPLIFQTTARSKTNNDQRTYSTTTTRTTTTTTTTPAPDDNKLLSNIELPDEVPDELRKQLLESGILKNAQISILDYDKVGDIPIEALPPDQLANFYGAGGAQQIAASEQKLSVVDTKGKPVRKINREKYISQQNQEKTSQNVEMKVVHYNPNTPQGQLVPESYVNDDATQVDPVVLNDNKYNRYLPVKVSGAQFPIPDVPELKGKKVSSVVVLAPVDYEFHSKNERSTRDIDGNIKEVQFISGGLLKELLRNPTRDNYKRWLEKENGTATERQSVVLLVTEPNGKNKEKEIFMYDVATQTVSKLSGELSSAFVEAAEANNVGDNKKFSNGSVKDQVPSRESINDSSYVPNLGSETKGVTNNQFIDIQKITERTDLSVES